MSRRAKFLDESGNDVGILSTIKCSPEMDALWSMATVQLGISKAELMKRLLYEYGIDIGLVNPDYLPADVPDTGSIREMQSRNFPERSNSSYGNFLPSPYLKQLQMLVGDAKNNVPEDFFNKSDAIRLGHPRMVKKKYPSEPLFFSTGDEE